MSNLVEPTGMVFTPDARLLVMERSGRIRVAQPGATQVDPTPFLQLTNIDTAGGERGLVGLTLDPNFAANGFYYVFYTASSPLRDRVSRFTASGNTTALATEQVVWQDNVTAGDYHHGGNTAFGPDGLLYISTGDHFDSGGSQPLTSYHGKILRVASDGTVPASNPFNDGAGPNLDAIWARGLRNPFRFSFDSATGRMYIGDVGGNSTVSSIEEVNIGVAGANYGWPTCEGNCAVAGMTNPMFTYPHGGRDASITGGLVYRGNQFPAEYSGTYFYGDYVRNWIKRLTFNGDGTVNQNANFEPADGANDGPYGEVVDLKQGPDGSLFYVDYGTSWEGDARPGSVRRIRYAFANQPPTASASANPTTGPAPLSTTFSSAGSIDPEGQPLTYSWDFGDGVTSTAANPVHVYQQPGNYTARLTVSDSANATLANPIPIVVGNVPVVQVSSPAAGGTFRAGDVVNFTGTATDAEDGPLPASAYTWTVLFHHETHTHPAYGPVSGSTSGSFTVPTTGHDFSGNTRYEVILTAQDSNGLVGRSSVFINPQKVNLTYDTVPSGRTIRIDGIGRTTPFVHDTLVNFRHTIEAANQSAPEGQYTFQSWSDGGAQIHDITVPATNQALTATYQLAPSTGPPPLVAYGFEEGTGTTSADASGSGNNATLTSTTWAPAGRYGRALTFNGTSSRARSAANLTLAGAFTAEAWVNNPTNTAYETIMTVGQNRDVYLRSGQLGLYDGAVERVFGTVPTGGWQHVAITYDGTNLRAYLGGVQLGAAVPVALGSQSGPLQVGAWIVGNGNSDYLAGSIDEVRVYNRALNAAEITTDLGRPVSTPAADTTPPVLSGGQPTGTLPAGTTQATLQATTNENATCRYATTAGATYDVMTGTFTTTGATSHSTQVTNLINGAQYSYYIRCRDTAGNTDSTDYVVSFSVAAPDSVPPTVSVSAPAGGATVSGTVTVTATAGDNIGVVGVQFLLDGAALGAEDTTAPYDVSWNTTTAANGTHVLTARARDAATNQTTSAPVSVTVNNAAAPSGLVAAYGFNANTGTAVADASPNANNGVLSGATWIAGRYGSALNFDGVNDWVTVNDSASLDLTTNMTVEAWVFPQVRPTGWRMAVGKESAGGVPYGLYAGTSSNNRPAANILIGGTDRSLYGGTRLLATTWVHLAMTYDGVTLRLYVDGTQVASQAQTGAMATSTNPLRIGGNGPFGEFFNGRIDEVRIYNRPLTPAQIQTDMNAPITP